MNEDEERGARCGLLSGKQQTLHGDVFIPVMRSFNGALKTASLFEGKRLPCMRRLHKARPDPWAGWNARHVRQTQAEAAVFHTNNDRCLGRSRHPIPR